MIGICLDRPILYKAASLRFFEPGEHHISRRCKDDVLVLVFDGILRFCENGVPYEIYPGQYHIQRRDSVQTAPLPSETPKYLYIHFHADWSDCGPLLPRSGSFSYPTLQSYMEEMDSLAHSDAPYILKAGACYTILSALCQKGPENHTAADRIAAYIAQEYRRGIRLDDLCQEFHFSKNHIINLFKQRYHMTPIEYANHLRLKEAEYQMEVTSVSLDKIATQSGFQNYSHFYKLFLRKHGQSPEKWRMQRYLGQMDL